MNPFDLPLNLADEPLIGMLAGLLLWSLAAAFVILVVELVSFLWLTIHAMRSSRLPAHKAVSRNPQREGYPDRNPYGGFDGLTE